MPDDHIRYDLLVREALRGVVRRVVADVARNGLPGEHHFYISFDTGAPGVKISPRLRAQYPEEMTIVLQHQFWDLASTDTTMEVGLSFSGIPEKLIVPFDAIKGFFDPSVQFGLEFEVAAEKSAEAESGPGVRQSPLPVPQAQARPPGAPGSRPVREPKPRRGRETDRASARKEPEAPTPAAPAEPIKQDGGAEVVSLDRFRKK